MRIKYLLRAVLGLVILFLPYPAGAASKEFVLSVRYRNHKPVLNLTREFRKALVGARPQVKVEDYFMRSPVDLVEKVQSRRPDLILAVGIEPVAAAATQIDDLPFIFTGIMKAELTPEVKARACGILLDVPLSLQLEYLQKILPEVKTVGIIYNEFENGETIKEAERTLGEEGIILRKFAVSSVKEINAIKKFHVNALIIIPDNIVCQPLVLRHLLLTALQQRIPVVGISAAYARAGALLALSPDYEAVGLQLAELAERVLRGEEASAIPIMSLSKVDCFINQAVAKHLGITVPAEMRQEAVKVFGQ